MMPAFSHTRKSRLPAIGSALRLALAIFLATAATARAQDWPIVRVYDGDTFFVSIPALPVELRVVGVRIRGIDSPEAGSRAKCPAERFLAEKARASLAALLTARPLEYRDLGWDKYGGRLNAVVLAGGVDIGAALVREGLARPYDGGTRAGWC